MRFYYRQAEFPGDIQVTRGSLGGGETLSNYGSDDPANPLNWSRKCKWTMVVLIYLIDHTRDHISCQSPG